MKISTDTAYYNRVLRKMICMKCSGNNSFLATSCRNCKSKALRKKAAESRKK